MASQDARLSNNRRADFKQHQSEMTNKIDTVLKAITDRIAGTLPSDTVKNLKLGTHPVLSARSYPIIDPQCSSYPSTSINAIKAHFNDAIVEPQQPEEPEPTLEDEFKDLHLNLLVLEVLAHAPIYNAILDKYVESLELGKNWSAFVQGETPAKMGDPGLFTLPCRSGDSKPFDTLTDHISGLANGTKSYPVGIVKDAEVHIGKLKLLNDFYVLDMKKDTETPLLVGRGFLATANAVIDCRMAKIAVGEGITRKDFLDCHLPREWEISRDAELNPFKDTLVFRRMVEFLGAIPINIKCNMWESEDLIKKPINWDKPPKNGDGAWHAKIRLIDPDGEEFTKTLQSIPTTRKLSKSESSDPDLNGAKIFDLIRGIGSRADNYVKVIKYMKKVLYDLTKVNTETRDFMEELEKLKCSGDDVKSVIFLNNLMRYFSFGRHLDELHVTWAHLEKKRTRLRTNTKTLEDLCSQSLETASQAIHDAVTTHQVTASHHFMTASARTDSNADLEDSSYDGVLENQLLSASLLICLGKRDCVERIPSGNNSPSDNRPNLEETLGKYLEESCKRQDIFDEWMKRFRENTNKNLMRHNFAIKGLEENVMRVAQAVTNYNKLNKDKIVKKIGENDGSPQETPTMEPRAFAEKAMQLPRKFPELVSEKTKNKEVSVVKMNVDVCCLHNELPVPPQNPFISSREEGPNDGIMVMYVIARF
ncbi:MAK10-like protein [Tanacetum coccineum]